MPPALPQLVLGAQNPRPRSWADIPGGEKHRALKYKPHRGRWREEPKPGASRSSLGLSAPVSKPYPWNSSEPNFEHVPTGTMHLSP